MDPFEYMKALTGMWGQSGAAFWSAQQNMLLDMATRISRAPDEGGPDAATPARFPDTTGLVKAGEEFAKLWSSALEISKAATQQFQPHSVPSPIVTEMLGKIFDPRLWFASPDNMDEALNRLAEGPRLADIWIVERKFSAIFNTWVLLRQRNLEHHKVMLDAWMQAAGVFAKSMNDKTANGEAPGSWRDVLAVWVDIANKTLLETQRTEPYLVSQRELLKASTALRLAQQEVMEFYSEMFGYPTRAELDDVHKTVTELRRELRALKRDINEHSPALVPVKQAAESTPPAVDLVAVRTGSRGQGVKSK
jgi:hypothetical protein